MASLLLWLAVFALGATPPDCTWQMDPSASKLGFRGIYQGEAFDGRFQKFQAKICYDPAALASAAFDVEIDITSVTTDNEERDSALAGTEFFDFARFPTARFVSKSFRDLSAGKTLADGELTLRGKTRPVSLNVEWQETGAAAKLIVDAQLDRLAFDIGSGEWADPELIGVKVDVRGELQLKRAAKLP